jgi:hypothetical protein
MRYDPMNAPESAEWLAADEGERLLAVQAWHERAPVALPSVRAHAVFHAAVEDQLAEGYTSTVRTLERLTTEGLDRHEAIHAIASVLAQHMHDLMKEMMQSFDNAAYSRDLDALTVKTWQAGSE